MGVNESRPVVGGSYSNGSQIYFVVQAAEGHVVEPETECRPSFPN